ncbi:MAG: hypothetical protein WA888_14350 [Burkholderiaceae bacterium]
MTDTNAQDVNASATPGQPQTAVATQDETLRKITIFDYALHIASPIVSLMLLSLIAVGINYVKRPDAVGSVYESHMDYMIRTFWWTALWLVVAAVGGFMFGIITLGIGFTLYGVFMALPVIWYLYRNIRGLLRALDNQPI